MLRFMRLPGHFAQIGEITVHFPLISETTGHVSQFNGIAVHFVLHGLRQQSNQDPMA